MAANTANVLDPSAALNLNNIRMTLQRMEDSIIFSLIERSQYKINGPVYEPDCTQLGAAKLHQLKSVGSNGCLGDWFIYQTECLHAAVRRYQHPTEYPFFEPLPDAILGSTSGARTERPSILAEVPRAARVNGSLLEIYRSKIVPAICEEGDDTDHGSTAVQDLHVLQTMATRIYYGLFVAESKFRTETDRASSLIKARDRDGLMEFITNKAVEEKNIQRVILKARAFAQNISIDDATTTAASGRDESEKVTTYKVNPEYLGAVFRDFIMPLTREVEVEYLLERLTTTEVQQN